MRTIINSGFSGPSRLPECASVVAGRRARFSFKTCSVEFEPQLRREHIETARSSRLWTLCSVARVSCAVGASH